MSLHPLVATLTQAVSLDAVSKAVVMPKVALDDVVARASGLPTDERRRVAGELVGFARTIWQHRGGLQVDHVVELIAFACARILGDVRRASDMLVSAGFAALGASIGARTVLRAPRTEELATTRLAMQAVAPRPVRGLRR